MAILKTGLKFAGLVLFVFVCWLGFNVARAQWQAHVVREANLDAVIFLVDYNIKQGTFKTPAPPQAADQPK